MIKHLPWIAVLSALTVILASGVLAQPQGDANIQVKLTGGDWTSAVTVESNGTENVLFLLLENTSNQEQTFHFQGPASDGDWQLAYFRSGGEEPNEFDVTLGPRESETVTVRVREQGAPDEYLFATFSLSHGGSQALAKVNLVVPGNLAVQTTGGTTWTGEDVLSSHPDDQSVVASLSPKSSASYTVRLQNVENASVSYLLRAQEDPNSAQIVRYYVDGEEISDEIRSAEGYETDALYPGEQLLMTVTVTPVGTDHDLRDVVITSEVAQIHEPPLNLTPVFDHLSPFAVHSDDVPAQGGVMTLYDRQGFAPGGYGLLNFDGGPFPVREATEWILSGYSGPLAIDASSGYVWISGGTGFRSAIEDAVEQIIGSPIALPVFDQIAGQGHNTYFRVVGFLLGTITESGLREDGYIRVTVDRLIELMSRHDAVKLSTQLTGAGLQTRGWRETH